MGVIVLVLRDRFEHALDVMQGQIAIAGVGERLDDGRRAHVVDEGLDQFHASDSLRVAGWSGLRCGRQAMRYRPGNKSEEHTSELQSLMRISYAVFCLKKKIEHKDNKTHMQ